MTSTPKSSSSDIISQLKDRLAVFPSASVGILGLTAWSLDVLSALHSWTLEPTGIYVAKPSADDGDHLPLKPIVALADDKPSIVVVASDEGKEAMLLEAKPYLQSVTQLVLSGFGHYKFHDPLFERVQSSLLVQSYANGYSNCLIHIFQCLKNAARMNLEGAVAEFGMFKGGTTMFMSRLIQELGKDWRVFGFDSFNGFPPARCAFDMYAHSDCEFTGEASVRRHFDGRNVEIVSGDVVEKVHVLSGTDIVLAFIDTDNFSSASAILEVVSNRIVKGGAIIFDHFPGSDRFLYTLGERIAAKTLLDDKRFFNLHGTGVFLRMSIDL